MKITPTRISDPTSASLSTACNMIASRPCGTFSPIMDCVYNTSLKDPLLFSLTPTEQQAQQSASNFLDLWYSPNRTINAVSSELEKMEPEGKAIVEQALEEFEEDDARGPYLRELAGEKEDEELFPPLSIDFLDIGMGSSTLFVCADGTTVLIDCGCHSRGMKEPAKDALTFLQHRLRQLQELRDLDAPTIDRIYITHPDQDHYNLFPSLFHLVENLKVGEFHIGGKKAEYKQRLDVFKVNEDKSNTRKLLNMSDIFNSAKVFEYPSDFAGEAKPSLVTKEVEEVGLGTQISFQIMGANAVPLHGETKQNACSLVILVSKPSSEPDSPPLKVLMMGDGEQSVEEKLVQRHKEAVGEVDLLHIGHHGAELAATAPFLEVTNPRVAQVSTDQVWAHPYRSTVERVTKNPKLRVNEAMENDTKRSIVVGQGVERSAKLHTQEYTTLAFLTNLAKQSEDKSGSEKAKKAPKGTTPMEAFGQQWNVTYRADNSFTAKSTMDDQNDNVEFL